MSILIKGADISPDHIQCITVFPEGFAIVEEYEMGLRTEATKCEVAPVPTPHGRLIDINDVKNAKFAAENINQYERWWNGALDSVIENAPTVIEAEEGGKERP